MLFMNSFKTDLVKLTYFDFSKSAFFDTKIFN